MTTDEIRTADSDQLVWTQVTRNKRSKRRKIIRLTDTPSSDLVAIKLFINIHLFYLRLNTMVETVKSFIIN